jgi:predicted  nucleic acid-binding Zn-ribbon protein
VIGQHAQEVHESGLEVGAGPFECVECGFHVSMTPGDQLPVCPSCSGERFRRASIFDQPTLDTIAVRPTVAQSTEWLDGVRASLEEPGSYLAMVVDGVEKVIALEEGWSRIGRSDAADIQLDDPTVSRRHAVVVHTPEGELRVLDDRSLNGITVNRRRVEWSPLADGDVLEVGRYRLHVVQLRDDRLREPG